MIDPAEWFWCDMCQQPAIACEKCGFSSCSGCGCGACQSRFAEAHKMVLDGTAPDRTFLPVKNLKSEVDRFFASAQGGEKGN